MLQKNNPMTEPLIEVPIYALGGRTMPAVTFFTEGLASYGEIYLGPSIL